MQTIPLDLSKLHLKGYNRILCTEYPNVKCGNDTVTIRKIIKDTIEEIYDDINSQEGWYMIMPLSKFLDGEDLPEFPVYFYHDGIDSGYPEHCAAIYAIVTEEQFNSINQ